MQLALKLRDFVEGTAQADVAVSSGPNLERSADSEARHFALALQHNSRCKSGTTWITTLVKTVQDAERWVVYWRGMGLSKFE